MTAADVVTWFSVVVETPGLAQHLSRAITKNYSFEDVNWNIGVGGYRVNVQCQSSSLTGDDVSNLLKVELGADAEVARVSNNVWRVTGI